MRTMAVIPSRTEYLVHGVTDHTPPLSRNRVVLRPVTGTSNHPIQQFRFDIPKLGILDRAVLRIRVNSSIDTDERTVWSNARDTILDYAECLSRVELYCKQRYIESLHPAAILHGLRHDNIAALSTYMAGSYAEIVDEAGSNKVQYVDGSLPEGSWGVPGGYVLFSTALDAALTEQARRPEFYIPLPFACFSSLRRNFQTNFVEPLSIFVHTKPFKSHQYNYVSNAAANGYYVDLVCHFHNYHPNVETTIRNSNYKQGVPATLPWHEWVVFDKRLSALSVGRAADVVPAGISYSLESDAIISDLLVIPKISASMRNEMDHQPDYYGITRNYYVVITGNGDVLFEASAVDLMSFSNRPHVTNEEDRYDQSWHSNGDLGSMPFLTIPLGMQSKNEQFTGGLALSSIVNPQITIYSHESVYRRTASSAASGHLLFPNQGVANATMEFEIVGKRHFILRIDSDTGVISRSIES